MLFCKKRCFFCGLLNHKSIRCLKVSNPPSHKEICKKSWLYFVLIKFIMYLPVLGIISVNTVVVNTVLQFVLLVEISYLDLTISLQVIWQIIKPTFYCKQPW